MASQKGVQQQQQPVAVSATGRQLHLRDLREVLHGEEVLVAAPEVRVREREAEAQMRRLLVQEPAQVVRRQAPEEASQQHPQ